MLPTIFEHLLSCGSCNSAVLIEDPSASHSTFKTEAGRVGLVIRHETREGLGSMSWLDLFPFTTTHPLSKPPPQGDAEQQSVSRQFICMEDCATPESRRDISKDWSLRWVSFEQHFETIAAWSGRKLGECPCECHTRHNAQDAACADGETASEDDECASINTTVALVIGEESDRCPVKPGGREAESDADCPAGLADDGHERARSEELSLSDLRILLWRGKCSPVKIRRDKTH